MTYELPDLNYDYDALEPYIDVKTMKTHHQKHHQGYTDKMNAVLEKYPDIAEDPIEELLANLDDLEMAEKDKIKLRQNGGGFVNHRLFWDIMSPEKDADSELVSDIEETFGSIEEFKEKFNKAAGSVFGSGWAWLVRTDNGLEIYPTANQNSPYLNGDEPIIGLDVWEHAYYLKYQNERGSYIDNWWNVASIV